jgi:LuxR family transcriptional regulator, maltose regulon positive regulatory protein
MTRSDARAATGATRLIESKLRQPRPLLSVLARRRLDLLLDDAFDGSLALVCAPAGYGKTVAIRSWLANGDLPAAWVSVDSGDNDPARLWTYVATAVARLGDDLAGTALERLSTASAAIEPAIDGLAADLEAHERRVAIVLDDVHLIDDDACMRSLHYAARVLPPNVALVLATRTEPALPLARMRSQDAVTEIRAAALAFTATETRALLRAFDGVRLSSDQADLLHARTEGWPAALHLAAVWLRGVEDRDAALRRFAGHHDAVSEYLAQEVLEGLDAETQAFLLRTSVLPRFCAELCADVLDEPEAIERIACLERRNLLLVGLDDRHEWFRYHALFAEFLAHRLWAVDPDDAAALHRRAAAWFLERELVEDAVEHARACADHETVARVLDERHLGLSRSGRQVTLLRWVDGLPEEVRLAHPTVMVGAALNAGAIGRPAVEVRRRLALAERAGERHPELWTAYEEAAACIVRAVFTEEDVGLAVRAATRAVELSRETAHQLLIVALAVLAHAELLAGRLDGARRAGEEAIDDPAAAHRPFGYISALGTLAMVAVERGEVHRARALADAALASARDTGLTNTLPAARAQLADAMVARAEGDVARAHRSATRALEVRDAFDGGAQQAWMLLVLADACVARGQHARAERLLAEAREMLARCRDAGRVPEIADAVAEALAHRRRDGHEAPLVEPPSPAELAVLRFLPSELSTRDIAAALFVSINTVRSHLRSLYRKLGVSSRDEAIARAGALGLLDEPDSSG